MLTNTKVLELRTHLLSHVRPFTKETTVLEAAELLSKHHHHSAPVMDGKTVIGFVDWRDIIFGFLKELAGETGTKDWRELEKRADVGQACKKFMSSLVKPLINASHADAMERFGLQSTLLDLATEMTGRRLHHVAIMDDNKGIDSIFSLSDLIHFVASSAMKFPHKSAADVCISPVVSLCEDEPVIRALQLLSEKQVTSLAVLDVNGFVVGNFSCSDLADVASEDFSKDLFVPLHQLALSRARVLSRKPQAPIVVQKGTALKTVALRMASFRVHHIYVVDESGRPVGIISGFEILKQFVQ
jgi:CBS domain-containing protein